MLSRTESSLLLYTAMGVFRYASEDVRKASFPACLSFFSRRSERTGEGDEVRGYEARHPGGFRVHRTSRFWTHRPLTRLSTRSTMNAGVFCMGGALSVRPTQPGPPSR